jgi:hypothetical protein
MGKREMIISEGKMSMYSRGQDHPPLSLSSSTGSMRVMTATSELDRGAQRKKTGDQEVGVSVKWINERMVTK